MPDKILHKRSLTTGSIPTTSSLLVGEIALNVPDGKIYIHKSGSQGQSIESAITSNSTASIGTLTLSGSLILSGSTDINSGSVLDVATDNISFDFDSLAFSGSAEITGSLQVTGGITGSLSGSATSATSASFAATASFVQTSQTASYVLNAVSSSFATSASFATTASFALSSAGGGLTVGTTTVTSGTNGRIFFQSGSVIQQDGAFNWDNTNKRLGIGTTPNARLDVSGSAIITGSLAVTQNITGSRMILSASNSTLSGSTLTIIGSGSAQPVFTVQGSQGELFSVTDSLSGSLFSVNDISGLPILEVFSDNTTLQGSYLAPALNTTVKNTLTSTGAFTVYSLPTSSYDGAWFEYVARSGSNARVGQIMAVWSASSANFTETTASQFGDTSGLSFTVAVTGSNFALTGSISTTGWTIKTIVRSI